MNISDEEREARRARFEKIRHLGIKKRADQRSERHFASIRQSGRKSALTVAAKNSRCDQLLRKFD